MEAEHEIVFTMTDYYDGPRGGIANFHGSPHLYESTYSDHTSDYTNETIADIFLLQPADKETLMLAEEDWAIWRRWETAFDVGETDISTHPALPAERGRHEELQILLTPRLVINPQTALRATAEFKVEGASLSEGGRLMAR